MGFLATGGLPNDQVVDLVMGRYQESYEDYRKYFSKVKEWYNLYRCVYTGERLPFKNVVMLPMLFSACWSDVANKAAISLSNSQIVEVDPIDPDAGPNAKRLEALLNQQFLDMNVLETMVDFLMSCDVYGTGIIEYNWQHTVVPTMYRRNVLGIEYQERVDVTTFDGPQINNLDILDFIPQAGKKDIDKMLYCHTKSYHDLDDLRDMIYVAQQSGKPAPFDPEAIESLADQPPASRTVDEMNERHSLWRSYSQYESQRTTKYGKPIEFIKMVGLVPREFAPDGIRFREIIIANRRVAVSNQPCQYSQMRKHFRAHSPMPDMHHFHGPGKVEMGATMAASANKLVSNRLDVLDLVLQPAIFASDATELDTQNLVLWPGRVIKVHGDTGESQIRPMQWDLQAYPLVANEVEAISRYIDQATGAQRDTIQGMLSGDRQTAREFLGRMEQARTRLGLESKLFERQVIEKLAMDMWMMDRDYLPVPQMVNLIGSAAVWDPDTGQPLPPTLQALDLTDLNMDHKVRAVGASNMLSKSMQRQDYITAMQAVYSNPIGTAMTNHVAFFNKFWRAFDLNPREMMSTTMPGLQAAWSQMNDQQRMGPEGDSLEQLGGGMLGQQDPRTIPAMGGMGMGLQLNRGQ